MRRRRAPQLFRKPLRDRVSAAWRDVALAVVNAPTFPLMFFGNGPDDPRRPETSPRSFESTGEFVDAFIEIAVPRFFPLRRKPYSRGAIASAGVERPDPGELWLYVNGIATSPGVLKANGKELARIFQRPIHLVHNPTDGIGLDLGECVLGRTFDFKTALASYVLDVVTRALRGYSRVVLIGHSQGGIVVANVVDSLVRSCEDRELLERLEVYTFASAADGMLADRELSRRAGRDVPYAEHFANGLDYVARIGVIAFESSTAGRLFTHPDRSGHLLNAHYLPGFERGAYCNGESRLYRYVGGGKPSVDDYPGVRSSSYAPAAEREILA